MVPELAPLEETGRLGVFHLKRYWSKALRSRSGHPPVPGETAADHTLLCGLHIGIEEAIQNILRNALSFEQVEDWVEQINGGVIDPARVERLNAALSGRIDPGVPPAPGSPEAALTAADLAFWDQHGYVLLHDAITPGQCRDAAEAIFQFIGAHPERPETWYRNPRGHSIWVNLLRHPAMEAARDSARVHAAFAQIWGRTDLWASIDQGGFNPPVRNGWRFPGPYMHWDASIAQPMPLGTQGILYLTDTSENQGAFTCVPGFHRRIAHWLESLPPGTNPRDSSLLEALPAIPIAAPAGTLIIWHHALPHGASPNSSAVPRVAQYIRMQPSTWEENPVWI